MTTQAAEVGETITMSPESSVPFAELPQCERRDVFFSLSETALETLVADLNRSQLEAFAGGPDPGEATHVLGFLVFLGLAD